MISVNIPKDLSRVKQKVVFNLTKRHLLQRNQEIVILIETLMCRFRKGALCSLGQPAEVFVFKRTHKQTEIINGDQDLQNLFTE